MSTLKVDALQTLDGSVTVQVAWLASSVATVVVDGLESTSATAALSANQGRVLNETKAGTVHAHTKSDVGLGNVDNTSDVNKPISTATQTALNAKQDTLVSGTNIKTVNGTSLIGTGDVVISGSASALNDLTDVVITTPSSGQVVSYNGTDWVNSTPSSGVTDHGLLSGLSDDDHPQYYNQTRGDARYAQISHPHTLSQISDWPAVISATEVGYLDNVASNIQTQLGSKLSKSDITNVSFTAYSSTGSPIEWSANVKQHRTYSANTTVTFTAPAGPVNLVLLLTLSGDAVVTWPATVKWPGGTVPTLGNGTHVITGYFNGTNYYMAAITGFA